MPAIATPHFRLDEWRKDPSKVDGRLCNALEAVRVAGGVPVSIHVAWDDAGHAPASYHYKGQAVDFHFASTLSREKQLSAILGVSQLGGIGWYPDWAHPGWHVDLRAGSRLFWIGKGGKYTYFQNDHAFARAAGMMEETLKIQSSVRGIRNNNPGNIRFVKGISWKGQIGADDKGFIIFDTPLNGLRAIARILLNYQKYYGLNTIRKIYSRWAPPNENDTDAYVKYMSEFVGVGPDEPIVVDKHLEPMVTGTTHQEVGQCPYSAALILDACKAART